MNTAKAQSGVLTRLRNYFLAGLLVTVPLGVTVALAWWLVNYVDQLVIPLLPEDYRPDQLFPRLLGVEYRIPGFGLVVLLAGVTFIGGLAAGIVGRWAVRMGENVLNRMPVVRSLYSATKQILETVLRDQSQSLRQAVLVEYPRRGLWAVAFVTTDTGGELARHLGSEHLSIFLPTTPNPTSGFLLLVPRDDVIELDMSVEDAVKLIISAGMVTPQEQLSGAERLLAERRSREQLERRRFRRHDDKPAQ